MDGNPLNTSLGSLSSIFCDKKTLEKERLRSLVIRQSSSSKLEWSTTFSSLYSTQRLTSSPFSLFFFSFFYIFEFLFLWSSQSHQHFHLFYCLFHSPFPPHSFFLLQSLFFLFSFSTISFNISITQSNSPKKISTKVSACFSYLLGIKIPYFVSISAILAPKHSHRSLSCCKSYQIALQMPPWCV